MAVGASPLKGRYLASNPLLRLLLWASDRFPPSPRVPAPYAPQRVLLAIGGHIGDAIIATVAIRELRRALPEAEIGLLVPSWAAMAIRGHGDVARVHSVDHWHSSRVGPRLARVRRYRASRRIALREIRKARYDVALDLYPFFPNSAVLLARAGIPARFGYSSGGFSSWYTHVLPWPDDDRHTAERHVHLLGAAFPAAAASGPLAYDLPPVPVSTVTETDVLLRAHGLERGSYVVIHPGTGDAAKQWPLARWQEVARRLAARGEPIAFTGQGAAEQDLVQGIVKGMSHTVDLVGQLTWPQFVEVVRGAARVVTVDTVAGHVAAAVGTPCTTIWTGLASPSHWRPLSELNTIVTNAHGAHAVTPDDVMASLPTDVAQAPAR